MKGGRRNAAPQRPVYLTAHLDHPAFVVSEVRSPREVIAEFRGGVDDAYFVGSEVLCHGAGLKGKITALTKPKPGPGGAPDKSVTVRLLRDHAMQVGDVITWNIPPTRIVGDKVLAPACDDLAGVAAALAAFHGLRK